ncbi:hypothetical protein, partial [Mesorhizobium sp. M7A.F.Ca.CA.002.10.1.1]
LLALVTCGHSQSASLDTGDERFLWLTSSSIDRVAVTYSQGTLYVPSDLFRERNPKATMDIKQVALRLSYPELKAGRGPNPQIRGEEDLLPLSDALGVAASVPGGPLKIHIPQNLLLPIINDLDAGIKFASFRVKDNAKGYLSHNIYYISAPDPMYIMCTGYSSVSSCMMSFDRAGLRWMIMAPRKYLREDVSRFHKRLSALIDSFSEK